MPNPTEQDGFDDDEREQLAGPRALFFGVLFGALIWAIGIGLFIAL